MDIIEASNLVYSYDYDGSEKRSLDGITLNIRRGELVAILGQNGSGKTTFVKHLNALLPVQSGELTVARLDASNSANIWKIRKECGMVFQDPNNQFVSSVIEEDIAFGLENFGTPADEIPTKIRRALEIVGMAGYEKKSPHMLSGGQKQRIAIAGVLAIDPDIIIFDEATAMLDPKGRQEVLATIQKLHDEEAKTIIMISHYVEEAIIADWVILLKDGRLLAKGTPQNILTDPALLNQTGLTPPLAVKAYYDLRAAGVQLPGCPLTNRDLVEALCQLN
ncbi:energy-coupling factor transporter ATPase [bacterium]|nr:energy-coupling factor transporter ATPase [bacterium]